MSNRFVIKMVAGDFLVTWGDDGQFAHELPEIVDFLDQLYAAFSDGKETLSATRSMREFIDGLGDFTEGQVRGEWIDKPKMPPIERKAGRVF